MYFEFAHDIGTMRFSRLDADPESYRDFLAATIQTES
jgi:hypothetical protein